jgi:uncharacterized protein
MPDIPSWKPSVFNLMLPHNGKHLLYNSVSSSLLELEPPQFALVQECFREIESDGCCSSAALLDGLARLGFVVPREEDEHQRERAKYHAVRRSRDRLLLCIAPTMACNMRCSYCFQRDFSKGKPMGPEIQRGLVEFVRRQAAGSKRVVVQWFGGEPLLAYSIVLSLTAEFQRICADLGVAYHGEMMTNAWLLTPEILASFPQIALRSIQIPLDGTPATYAARRQVPLAEAQRHYEFLIEHMPAIVESVGSVTLRINVDRDNAAEAQQVVAMFKRAGVTDRRIDFRLGFLNTRDGLVDCIPHDCLSPLAFGDLELAFRRFLAREGYYVYDMPAPIDYPCMAAQEHAFTVDPLGRIGKCVPATGTTQATYCRIYPDDIERTLRESDARLAPFRDSDPYESPHCRGCGLLPACLGSCPKLHDPPVPFHCRMKDRLAETLVFFQQFHNLPRAQ